jgi:4-diphosphocytidyl-2-C-methyl-D-erythritol kinase
VFVATSEAYSLLSSTALTSRTRETILAGSREQAQIDDSHQLDLTNDFEPVIFDREPEIKRARDTLLRCGAQAALLAGSGSSVFGIFEDPTARTRALSEIEAEAGWRIFPCVTISRREYSREMNSVGDLRSV